jgi:uncharacterized protein
METIDNILVDLYQILLAQPKYFFEISLYLGIAARLIYTICFIALWKSLSMSATETEGSEQSLGNTSDEAVNWDKKKFFMKELAMVIVAVSFNLIAVFIFSYSLLVSGTMLLRASKNNKEKGNKLKIGIQILFGILFKYLIPIAAVIILTTRINAGDDMLYEIIVVGLGILVWLGKQIRLPKIQTMAQFYSAKKNALWHQEKKIGLVIIILIIILVPFTAYGLFTARIYSKRDAIMLPMRDGVKLKTYIYYPPNYNGEKLPVIMCRTPYHAQAANLVAGSIENYVTNKGYILILQDLRGCFDSEGEFPLFNSDNTDGNDTCDWIVKQSWSNGKIASIGGSAVATNQYYYHAEGAQGMASANILMGASEYYDYWMFPGGCYRKGFSDWWLPAVTTQSEINKLLAHPSKDDYWTNSSVGTNERYKNINMRALHVGGWYDCFQQGTLTGFEYYNYKGTDYAKGHQILIMGPWGHGMYNKHVDVTFPESQGNYIFSASENFLFEETLWGKTKNWTTQPNVYYYVMGDPDATNSTIDFNNWRTGKDWPLTNITYEPWYLHSSGAFSSTTPTVTNNKTFIFNPINPVLTRGGTTLLQDFNGACDQKSVESGRTDILSFYSGNLTTPVEIIGRVNATIYLNSNCTDTDINVKLMDVYPDGKEMYVASGILKARYRNGFRPADIQMMVPGKTYEFSIDMWSTAYRFVPGHQIKISVTSSDYPKFAVNPNTGGTVEPTFTTYKIAENTVICGEQNMYSCVWFPCNL